MFIQLHISINQLLIWITSHLGRYRCNGAKARKRKKKNLSDWTRSGVHAFWHAQDGAPHRLLFTDYQSATRVYRILLAGRPTLAYIKLTFQPWLPDGSYIIYSRVKMRGVKEEIFLLRSLYFIPIVCLSSKRSWNASQQDPNSQHLWDIQNLIPPSKHVPKKTKKQNETHVSYILSSSFFFFLLQRFIPLTQSLARSLVRIIKNGLVPSRRNYLAWKATPSDISRVVHGERSRSCYVCHSTSCIFWKLGYRN